MLVPLGIALPIVLLILVVQYSNKFAFLAVVFIFQFSIFHEFESLFKSLHSFLTQDRAIHWAFFGDPMKGFQDALIFIPLIFLALIILNNIFKQEKVAIYRQEYLISMVCALGLVLLSPVISNVINYIISFG